MYHRNLRQDISFRMNIKNRRYINLFFDHAGRFNNKKIIIYVAHSCVVKMIADHTKNIRMTDTQKNVVAFVEINPFSWYW